VVKRRFIVEARHEAPGGGNVSNPRHCVHRERNLLDTPIQRAGIIDQARLDSSTERAIMRRGRAGAEGDRTSSHLTTHPRSIRPRIFNKAPHLRLDESVESWRDTIRKDPRRETRRIKGAL